MNSKSIYKVPNGKLLKIMLDYNEKNNVINSVIITGDFFAYPEEAIEALEKELKNTKLDKQVLYNKIDNVIKVNNFEFIGLDVEGLVTGIIMCVDQND